MVLRLSHPTLTELVARRAAITETLRQFHCHDLNMGTVRNTRVPLSTILRVPS